MAAADAEARGRRENRMSAAEALVAMLEGHGVDTVFGLCGDTSLPFYDALYRTGGAIRHVLTRDERHAAYMADGYARVTGKVGVCEGPSGGGATYILPGLVEANESSIPVLAITSDVSVSGRGRFTLTELDQTALMRPLTKWNRVVETGSALPRAVRAAFRAMTTGRPGSAHIGVPLDVQRQPVDADDVWADSDYASYPAERHAPDAVSVERAARILRDARTPVVVCGGGVVVSGAEAALAAFAEALGAPVATTVSGQGSIGDEHPLALGVIGSNGGTPATRRLVEEADAVVFVGCRAGSVTTERWRYPAPGGAKIVHLDVDPQVIGVNYATDAAVVGDARASLEALTAALGAPAANGNDAEARVARARAQKRAAFEALAVSDEAPIRPERIVATLARLLPDDAIVVADPGTPCPYFSAYFDWRGSGRRFITNRAHGALGYALAAAMGAHIGRPSPKCVAVVGDGSFAMSCGELETLVRLGLPITVVVISNAVFGWIKAGQKSGFGGRYYSVDFSVTEHAAVAAAFGLESYRVEDPAELEATLARALDSASPTLVDVVTQPLQDANAPVSEWIA
ncbi:MAG: thiamine pyrophosphate-binding protein [Gammaproteobacteria bacterium]|nr:thiamine pyrophosphate-binding protein [Gammaproteobacteria bacterium]